MNELLTSQPLVILTGAGASKWLGKATTFDIYESEEFKQRANTSPFSIVRDVRDWLLQKDPEEPVDLEFLLDYIDDLNRNFDELHSIPHYQEYLQRVLKVRQDFGEAYEQARDFIIAYYGRVDARNAESLYGRFFDGLVGVLGEAGQSPRVISLFTLNYDEAVESAVDELSDYDLLDGFRPGYRPWWSRDIFESFQPASRGSIRVALLKLHGSVSWTRSSPSARVERTIDVPRRSEGKDHVVLYPTSRAKPVSEEPFATAYEYLEAALSRARLAVFIGTSFRDAELNEVIRREFERRRGISLLAASPRADAGEISTRIGIRKSRIYTARLRFEPASIPKLMERIRTKLGAA